MQAVDQPSIEEIRTAVKDFPQQLKIGHTLMIRRVGSFYGDEYPITLTPEIMAMLNATVALTFNRPLQPGDVIGNCANCNGLRFAGLDHHCPNPPFRKAEPECR